ELQVGGVDFRITLPEQYGWPENVRRQGLLALPNATCEQRVILDVASHARKVLQDIDAEAMQLLLISHARLHQDLGRVDGSEREHDLTSCANALHSSLVQDLHAHRALAVEDHARHERAG